MAPAAGAPAGLALGYDRASARLDATAAIFARATQPLTRFDLDLCGFDISLLLVDGRPASYRRAGQEPSSRRAKR